MLAHITNTKGDHFFQDREFTVQPRIIILDRGPGNQTEPCMTLSHS